MPMEGWIGVLPHLQAGLNALAAVVMTGGYLAMRAGRREWHRRAMLGAVGVSLVFLISYLVYHGAVGNVKFVGQGWVRSVYFTILISHVVLAAVLVPLVPLTLAHALRREPERHRGLARWTLPVWMYVSVTGVVVYWLAYHRYPSLP